MIGILLAITVATTAVMINDYFGPEVIYVNHYYPYLPPEVIEVGVRGLEQAVWSHQYFIDNVEITEENRAFHLKTIDKYRVAIWALEALQFNDGAKE